MQEREFILQHWGESGRAVLDAIDAETKVEMTMKEFLSHCCAMGGNWCGMLLTGIKELYPAVYDAIPDNMGRFAWFCLCNVLILLGVSDKEGDQA